MYIRECTTTTGTFTTALVQGSTIQRSVTVNKSDLSGTTLSTQTGSWYYFKFGSSFTTLAGSAYTVSVSASTSGVVVYNNGVSGTLTKGLVTSTTAALGAGEAGAAGAGEAWRKRGSRSDLDFDRAVRHRSEVD